MVNLLEYLGMEGLAWWCDVGKIDKGCGLRVLVGALSQWIFIWGWESLGFGVIIGSAATS
jgi:hypothetical protein